MKYEIRGADELMRKLQRITQDMLPMMERATKKAVFYVHGEVPPYPAEPPMSSYRRTGTLGRSITTEVRSLGSQIVGVIGTATVYAPWVISDEAVPDGRGPQARVHAGRWWTLQGVVRKAKDEVVRIYQDFLRQLIER